MAAYVIVDIQVTDPIQYEEYRKLAPAIVAAYGGKYLARGGQTSVLEGTWTPTRLVILEFESVERAKAWWDSPEYATAKQMRIQSTHSNLVILDGLPPN
jgi:uncharacterized protein (DUF1330 family)